MYRPESRGTTLASITTGGHKTLPYKNMRIYRAIRTLSQHWERVVHSERVRVVVRSPWEA